MLYLIGRKEISLHILDKKTEEEDFLSKKQYERARSLNPPSSYDSQNSSILDLDLQSIDPFELSRYNISEDVHNVSLQDNSPYIYKHLQQLEERRRSSPFDISIYDDPLSMDDPSYDYNNIQNDSFLGINFVPSIQKKRIHRNPGIDSCILCKLDLPPLAKGNKIERDLAIDLASIYLYIHIFLFLCQFAVDSLIKELQKTPFFNWSSDVPILLCFAYLLVDS